MSSLAKLHKINPHANTRNGWAKTFCGLLGVQERNTDTEYSTIQGFRFEATTGKTGVNCAKCRKGRWDRSDDPTGRGLGGVTWISVA